MGNLGKDPLFLVAISEFVILFTILGWWLLKLTARKNKKENKNSKNKEEEIKEPAEKDAGQTGQIGIIKNLQEGWKDNANRSPVTIFKIEQEGGKFFFAGVDGHQSGLKKGYSIEYWPSSEVVAYKISPRAGKINYYKLRKYLHR